MRRNLLSSVLVTVSLCIGVMSVLVTHELSVSILDRFSSTGIQGAYDKVIRLSTQTEQEYFQVRQWWRKGEMPQVTHVVPVIEGMLNVEGKVFNVLGYDPIATMPTAGDATRGMQADSRFMLENSVIAFGSELQPNDRISGALVVSSFDARQRRLVADLPTAQRLLGREAEVDAVWLRAERTKSPWWDLVVPGLLSATQSEATEVVLSGYDVLPFTLWDPSEQLGDAIVFNLGMLSLLTLLVAGFIVFQAIQSNLRNREVQIVLLDSLGVSETQQRLLIFLQCSLFGFAGCIFGVAAGLAILSYLNGTSAIETWRSINEVAFWKAVVLGSTTAMLVGVFAQRRVTRRRNYVWWIASGLALAGIAYGISDRSGLLGASLLSVCFCLLSIFCIVPLAIKIGAFGLKHVRTNSITLRMNLRNALTTADDIRLAINALSIAVATAIGIGLMLGSFKTEFSALLEQRLASDLDLSDAAGINVTDIEALPNIETVRSYQRGLAQLAGVPVQVTAAKIDRFEQDRYGYSGESKAGIFVNEIAARTHGFRVGQHVSVDIARNPEQPIPILHIFKDYGEIRSRAIVPSSLVRLDQLVADRFSIDTSRPDAARLEITERYPNVSVVASDELRNAAIQIFNASFATAQVMVNIAIFVAVIGMACALVGMQAKRLKEMRLLTMMGTSRAKLALSALLQNALIGVFATIVALPLSFAIAWNLCYLVNPRAYGWSFDLAFTWEPVLMPILLGVFAAMLAGLEPMRQALGRLVSQPISSVR